MILQLRNKNKQTLVDVEIYKKKSDGGYPFIELHSSIDIEQYSRLFLTVQKQNLDIEQFINIFDHINNLRMWLNENFFMGEQNDINKLPEVIKQVKSMLEVVANQYELYYYED
jgi:hypothetical protein